MHLADAFIQNDLQCIQAIHVFVSTNYNWSVIYFIYFINKHFIYGTVLLYNISINRCFSLNSLFFFALSLGAYLFYLLYLFIYNLFIYE